MPDVEGKPSQSMWVAAIAVAGAAMSVVQCVAIARQDVPLIAVVVISMLGLAAAVVIIILEKHVVLFPHPATPVRAKWAVILLAALFCAIPVAIRLFGRASPEAAAQKSPDAATQNVNITVAEPTVETMSLQPELDRLGRVGSTRPAATSRHQP